MRRALSVAAAALAMSTPTVASTPDSFDSVSGSAAGIREVISGRTCVGGDVLRLEKYLPNHRERLNGSVNGKEPIRLDMGRSSSSGGRHCMDT